MCNSTLFERLEVLATLADDSWGFLAATCCRQSLPSPTASVTPKCSNNCPVRTLYEYKSSQWGGGSVLLEPAGLASREKYAHLFPISSSVASGQ